ncbi:Uncharacterized protein Fot_19878 [Forsythia ovata]|uniref:Uncharacterized protein n=1 Tax=Forsythia ovata TaxID=205694 RepID=A0ABD1VMC5_9LAMI
MKVDELRSTAMDSKDIDELRSENKILRSRLAISEDANSQDEFKIIKFETIQRFSVNARKQAELKLKVCEDMAYAKHKELTEVLTELPKAKELLAKLGASSIPTPKGWRRSIGDNFLKEFFYNISKGNLEKLYQSVIQ